MSRKFKVGDEARLTTTITEKQINEFAQLTGDHNPIHMDAEFASKTPFGVRIAHGAMISALFSRLAGMELPGPGTVVLSAEFSYKKPAMVGDEVTAVLRVKKMRPDKPIVFIDCVATNQSDEVLVEGTAVTYRLLE